MPRNLDHRVEVLFPVTSRPLVNRIRDRILASYLVDDCRARLMNPDGTYTRAQRGDGKANDSQDGVPGHRRQGEGLMDRGRRLYFLRHGLADHPDFRGDDDRRPLTRDGEVRMRRQAAFLAGLDLDLDVILASPLTRAAQTAAIVAGRLGLADRVLEEPRLGPGFDVEALAAILADLPDSHRRIMLVGHEPGLSTVVGAITGGSDVVCKKGGLARVDLDDGDTPRSPRLVAAAEGDAALAQMIPPAQRLPPAAPPQEHLRERLRQRARALRPRSPRCRSDAMQGDLTTGRREIDDRVRRARVAALGPADRAGLTKRVRPSRCRTAGGCAPTDEVGVDGRGQSAPARGRRLGAEMLAVRDRRRVVDLHRRPADLTANRPATRRSQRRLAGERFSQASTKASTFSGCLVRPVSRRCGTSSTRWS